MDSEANTTVSFFHLFINGQIESALFPLGPDADEVFCRYEVIAGADWELISGMQNGITQSSSNKNGKFHDKIVFNMPIELTYKSTSPFGWPQLLICLYGKTRWGVETTLGYCRVHLPVFGAQTTKEIKMAILIPKCTNMLSELNSWITGKNAELRDAKILMDGNKSRGLSVESYGELILKLNSIARGLKRLGYDCS